MTAGHEHYRGQLRRKICVEDSAPSAQKNHLAKKDAAVSVTMSPRLRYGKQGELQAPNRREGSRPVFTHDVTRETRTEIPFSGSQEVCEPIQAAEIILRRLGARAISILTSPRPLGD